MNESPSEMAKANSAGISRLGPFQVSTGQVEVEAFRRETGWPQSDAHVQTHRQILPPRVPHTFPMRWLSCPQMRAAIESELQAAGGIAFHESQNFAYEEQLDAGCDYLLQAEIDRQQNPTRLILRVSVEKLTREPVLRMETILRIVTAADAAP